MANANTKRIPWKSLQIEKELSVHTLDIRVRARPRSLPSSDIGWIRISARQTDKMIDKSLDNMGEVFKKGGKSFRRFFEIFVENICNITDTYSLYYIALSHSTLSSRSVNFPRKNFLILT